MSNENNVEIENSLLGKVRVTGDKANLIFTVLSVMIGGATLISIVSHMTDTKEASKELALTMRDNAQATREQTCIISLPQERREVNAEFCKRLAR